MIAKHFKKYSKLICLLLYLNPFPGSPNILEIAWIFFIFSGLFKSFKHKQKICFSFRKSVRKSFCYFWSLFSKILSRFGSHMKNRFKKSYIARAECASICYKSFSKIVICFYHALVGTMLSKFIYFIKPSIKKDRLKVIKWIKHENCYDSKHFNFLIYLFFSLSYIIFAIPSQRTYEKRAKVQVNARNCLIILFENSYIKQKKRQEKKQQNKKT